MLGYGCLAGCRPRQPDEVFRVPPAVVHGAHRIPVRDFLRTHEERNMNWDIIEGNWKQVKGKFKEQWGKLTDDDFDTISGRRDQLTGKIQERYGLSRDDAERQVKEWQERANDDWFH
jgi:uncharacterized protein YjbJ (UPF0337 family)